MEDVTRKTIALRYGHIEAALAEIMNIEPGNAKAFHARLRHLRNIGVPTGLPAPGKGQAIKYTRQHAFELLMAVSLQNAGQGPKLAAKIAKDLNEVYQTGLKSKTVPDQDIYVAIFPPVGRGDDPYVHWTIVNPELPLPESLRLTKLSPVAPVVTLINLTRLDLILDQALHRQIYI